MKATLYLHELAEPGLSYFKANDISVMTKCCICNSAEVTAFVGNESKQIVFMRGDTGLFVSATYCEVHKNLSALLVNIPLTIVK